MKIKSIITVFLLIAVFSTPLVAAGKTETSSSKTTKATIYLYQNKIEIDKALHTVAQLYQESHPNVEFIIESTSDGYSTGLRTKFAGGQAPDIFTITGGVDMQLWLTHLEDLTEEKWVEDMIPLAKEGITANDGKIYGMPVSVEGVGYVYNKRLFEQAGIASTPKTLTELKEGIEKLKKAGITPLTGTYMDWYQPGMFLVNMGFARQENPLAFIEGLNKGTETIIGNRVFEDVANFILYEFSQAKNPLNTGFNQQTSMLIAEEIGMTLGGNYLQPSIDSTNPDMRAGIMPIPINEDAVANDKLYVGVTGYWGVNKNSLVKPEVKEFLTWLTTSPEGKKAMTDTLLFLPPFSSISANPLVVGSLSNDVATYTQAGKVYGIYNSLYPAGAAEQFGIAVQKLVANRLNVQQFLTELQTIWNDLK